MDLSVVIVNYNVRYFLEQALTSARKAADHMLKETGWQTEIWVVDNNSTDDSVEMVRERFPEVKLIANKQNTGFSYANNQAIRESNAEFVLLLNPDTIVPEDCFIKSVGFMKQTPDAGGVGAKMLDGSGKFLPESKRGFPSPAVAFYKIFGLSAIFPKSRRFGKYHLGYLDDDEIHRVDVLAGAFMLLRRTALEKIGLLDEDFFMYGEDIDLSYRIVKGGYQNYYFPDTEIIHYKGESTKKSSINYVFVFYRAMVIFARKHLPRRSADLFAFFINLAIYLRAGAAVFVRFLKRIALPVFDFAVIYGLMYLLVKYWERTVTYHGAYGLHGYPRALLAFFVPVYILVWIIGLFLSSAYQRPFRFRRLVRGVAIGTALISIGYAFLPEHYRFSRAIVLLGGLAALIGAIFTRLIVAYLKDKRLILSEKGTKRIVIIGSAEEYERVVNLLEKTKIEFNIIGRINPVDIQTADSIGTIGNLKETLKIYRPDELIFCNADYDYMNTIRNMEDYSPLGIQFKTVPEGSNFVIGSSSKNEPGDYYTFTDNFELNTADNRLNKRLLDIGFSIFLLFTLPFNIWFVKDSGQYIRNIFRTLGGRLTWVGYSLKKRELPPIHPGILHPTDELNLLPELDDKTLSRLDYLYAKEYNVYKDLSIIFKAFSKLGRKINLQ
jgi:GT2 family glycosyltransferase